MTDIGFMHINLSLFRLAVENASDHIIITDDSGRILYANNATVHVTGYSPNELEGKTPRLWGGLMDESFYRDMWQTIKTERKPYVGKIMNKRKNGEVYDALIRISPIVDDMGILVGFVGTEEDISEQVRIDKAKSEFVSLASHQLRTPLTSIKWYSEMLLHKDAGEITDKQHLFINEIVQATSRMNHIVRALLNVSRIELGTFSVVPKLISIKELIEASVHEVDVMSKQKNITVRNIIDHEADTIIADPDLLQIVLNNLLTNAIKYTPPGGKVTLNTQKDDAHISIVVSDTGMGVSKEDQEKIFTKLYRSEKAISIDSQGTGLGLYIVKSILDHCGGDITCVSEEGKGSVFTVILPIEGMKPKTGTKKLQKGG